jgi:lysophospholipase L1-like esterase
MHMKQRLLLPLAVVQGLWVLQRTPRLPSPPGRAGRVGAGAKPLRVVGVGDSIIAGTGVHTLSNSLTGRFAQLLHEHSQRCVEWRVNGMIGATSTVVLHKLAPQAPAADMYVVSAGVNDVTRGIELAKFESNLRQLFDLLRRKSPSSTIFFGGLPPFDSFPALPWPLKSILAARAAEMQDVAASVTQRYERAVCFDFPATMPAEQFAADGFHPAEQACETWARGLLDLWSQPARPRRATTVVRDRGAQLATELQRSA